MVRNKTWFNKSCNLAFKKKCKLYKTFLQNPNVNTECRYKQYNKYYKKLIRKTKNDHDKSLIEAAGSDPKRIWNTINTLLGKFKQHNPIYLKQDEKIINDSYQIANIFNEKFNVVGDLFGASPVNDDDYKTYMPKKQTNNFPFKEVTLDEINQVIRSLNARKSSNDVIPIFLIKRLPENMIKRLMYVFNLSITVGVFPDVLKHSKIIPVYKNGSKLECTNYRPISLLSCVDEIFEKLIHSRLYEYLMNIDFFCRNQYGFRAHHSPEYALISLMDRIYKHIDSKRNVLVVSLDLRKAFEVIRHEILLNKLDNAGIRGPILNWFS